MPGPNAAAPRMTPSSSDPVTLMVQVPRGKALVPARLDGLVEQPSTGGSDRRPQHHQDQGQAARRRPSDVLDDVDRVQDDQPLRDQLVELGEEGLDPVRGVDDDDGDGQVLR